MEHTLNHWIKAYERAAVDTHYRRLLAGVQHMLQYTDSELISHYQHHAEQYRMYQGAQDRRRFVRVANDF